MKRPKHITFAPHFVWDDITENCRTHVVEDEFSKQITTFKLHISEADGSGGAFPCDSAGNVFFDEMTEVGQQHYLDRVSRESEHASIEVVPTCRVFKKCNCGSGLEPDHHYDARGIFLCRACPKCRKERLGRYRRDVLTNSNYLADEAIESEDY